MKRLFILLISLSTLSYADEGMWVPLLLQQTCYDDMVEQGLLLSVDEIYNEEEASFKDTRYILFIIDKYAETKNILSELVIID